MYHRIRLRGCSRITIAAAAARITIIALQTIAAAACQDYYNSFANYCCRRCQDYYNSFANYCALPAAPGLLLPRAALPLPPGLLLPLATARITIAAAAARITIW